MTKFQWSKTNDPVVWDTPDEGKIRFASEEDCQKMMRLLQRMNEHAPEARAIELLKKIYHSWALHGIAPELEDEIKALLERSEPQSDHG